MNMLVECGSVIKLLLLLRGSKAKQERVDSLHEVILVGTGEAECDQLCDQRNGDWDLKIDIECSSLLIKGTLTCHEVAHLRCGSKS
jgi:hypothetical protein